MQVWIPLLSALVGGLIAVIPVLLTLNRQSKEREKDRQEQRKEAKFQANEKWIDRDISKLMETLVEVIKTLSELGKVDQNLCRMLEEQKKHLLQEGSPLQERLAAAYKEFSANRTQIEKTVDGMIILIHSFSDDAIDEQWNDFRVNLHQELENRQTMLEHHIKLLSGEESELNISTTHAALSSAKLYGALRDKLISIRDL